MIKGVKQYRIIDTNEDGLPVLAMDDHNEDGLPMILPPKKKSGGSGSAISSMVLSSGLTPSKLSEREATVLEENTKKYKQANRLVDEPDVNDPIGSILKPVREEAGQLFANAKKAKENARAESLNQKPLIPTLVKDQDNIKMDEDALYKANVYKNKVEHELVPEAQTATEALSAWGRANGVEIPVGYDGIAKLTPDVISKLPKKNETLNTLTKRIGEYDSVRDDFEKSGGDIKQAAVIAYAKENPFFAKQLSSLQDAKGNNFEDAIPAALYGRIVDSYLRNKNVAIAASKDEFSNAQYEHLKNNLLTDIPEYGANIVSNELSREREKRGKNNWLGNFPEQEYMDKLATEMYANDPQKLQIYNDIIKKDLPKYIDAPGILEHVAGGVKHAFKGQLGSVEQWLGLKSEGENIYDTLKEQGEQVSADGKGLHSITPIVGDMGGLIAEMAVAGSALKGLGLVTDATAANTINTIATFYGDEKKKADTEYPGEPNKSLIKAGIMTTLFSQASHLLPTKRLSGMMNKVSPEVGNIVKQLSDGAITKEAAKDATQKLFQKLTTGVVDTGKKVSKAALENMGIVEVGNMTDKVLNMDADQFHQSHPRGELLDAAKMAVFGTLIPSALATHGNRNMVKDQIYDVVTNKERSNRILDQQSLIDPDIAAMANERKELINHLSNVKRTLDEENIPVVQQKSYLLQSAAEQAITKKIEATADPVIQKKYKDELKKVQEIKEGIWQGIPEEQVKTTDDVKKEEQQAKDIEKSKKSAADIKDHEKNRELDNKEIDIKIRELDQESPTYGVKKKQLEQDRKETNDDYDSKIEKLSKDVNPDLELLGDIKSSKGIGENESKEDLSYFVDKAGEAPLAFEKRFGKKLTTKMLEQVPTKKLVENYKLLAGIDEQSPEAKRLDEIIAERESPAEVKESKVSIIRPEENKPPNIIELKKKDENNETVRPEEVEGLDESNEQIPTTTESKSIKEPTGEGKTVEEGEKVTSIKNEQTLKERQERGMKEVEVLAKRTFKDVFDNSKKMVDSGEIDPRLLAKEMSEKPRPLKPEESTALLYDRMRLHNEYQKTVDEIVESTEKGDEVKEGFLRAKLADLEVLRNINDEAARRTGYEQGLGLGIRQLMIKQDYSLLNQIQEFKAANGGQDVSPEMRMKLEGLTRELEIAQRKLEEYEKRVSELEANSEIKKTKKANKTKEQFKEDRDKIRESISDKLRKARGETSAVILPYAKELIAIAPDIAKLVKSYAEEGFIELKEIVSKIHDDLKPHIEDITKEDVLDVISGKYNEKKSKPILDRKQMMMKANVEKVKKQIDAEKEKLRLQNRGKAQKFADYFQKWRRFALLSGVKVLGKISVAAATRSFIVSPIESAIGAGLREIPGLKKIAEGAPREGGRFNAKAEAKALTQWVDAMTYKDIREIMKTGKGELDYLYGKKIYPPPDFLDFFGQLHASIKNLPKRVEFFRSFELRAEHAAKNGKDLSDPLVQEQIGIEAYNDSLRAIFMQDNYITDAYKNMIRSMEVTKIPGGKMAAEVMKFLFPIIKVPTNYVAEESSYMIGGLKAAFALRKGIKDLTPDQKNYIMRAFKKQTIGIGFIMLGYFNPQAVGGYYSGKRKEDDLEAGDLKIFGVKVPHWMSHTPLLECLQLGATLRRSKDEKEAKGKKGNIMSGLPTALKGVTSQIPFFGQGSQISTAMGSQDGFEKYIFRLGQSVIEPQLIKEVAEWTDTKDGETVKRTPEDFIEQLKMGVPGLREDVKEKKSSNSHTRPSKPPVPQRPHK